MTNQQVLLYQIRQEKLKPKMRELLDAGISRHTIETCIREWCKSEHRHALPREPRIDSGQLS